MLLEYLLINLWVLLELVTFILLQRDGSQVTIQMKH
jgi:hypothetical protein